MSPPEGETSLAAARGPGAVLRILQGLCDRKLRVEPEKAFAAFLQRYWSTFPEAPLFVTEDLAALAPPPDPAWRATLERLLGDAQGETQEGQAISDFAVEIIQDGSGEGNLSGAEVLLALGHTDVFKQVLLFISHLAEQVARGDDLDETYRIRGLLDGFKLLLAQLHDARHLFELADWISERKLSSRLHYRDQFERPDGSHHDFIREIYILEVIAENLERIRVEKPEQAFTDEVNRAMVSPHKTSRALAISGLSSPEEVGIEKLRALLQDPSNKVRARVLELLLKPKWGSLAEAAVDVLCDEVPDVRILAARVIRCHPAPRLLLPTLDSLSHQLRQAHRNPGHESLYKGNVRCVLSPDEEALKAFVGAAMHGIRCLKNETDFRPILEWLKKQRRLAPIPYPEAVDFFFLGGDEERVERFFDARVEVLCHLRHRLADKDPSYPRPAPQESELDWAFRVLTYLPEAAV